MTRCASAPGHLIGVGLALAALIACVPPPPLPESGVPTAYEGLAAARVDAEGYETDFATGPASALTEALAAGPHHTAELVQSDGFTNHYRLTCEFGVLEVASNGLLRKRVHEVEVLAALEAAQVSGNKVYLMSTANAARGPVEGAAQLLIHPVRSAKDVPSGMWSYARRLVELKERNRTYQEDHYGEELIGFGDAKREWAYRLGVDVYSANPLLQARLDRYAWFSLSGGLTVRLPLMAVSGPASYALTVTGTTDQMKRELRDLSPEEIRIDVRKRLLSMDVDPVLVERFVAHPWYSPTRLLVIAEALGLMEGAEHRDRFIGAAVHADEPEETYFFMRIAVMLAMYGQVEAPVRELLAPNGLVMARAGEGDVVVPLYLDWGLWTRPMEEFAAAMQATIGDGPARRRILASGRLSPTTRFHLEAAGWDILDGVEETWLAELDAEARRPGGPDPDRVLPEFGN